MPKHVMLGYDVREAEHRLLVLPLQTELQLVEASELQTAPQLAEESELQAEPLLVEVHAVVPKVSFERLLSVEKQGQVGQVRQIQSLTVCRTGNSDA
jgi:hypothetical protein